MKPFNNHFFPIFLVISFSLLAILPLFNPGFFAVHDDTQVVRVFEMNQALRDGQFPVRTVMGLGYGFDYPIFNYYAPLAYYFGAIINFAVDALTATKIMFAFGLIFSGISMYLLGQKVWGKLGGIVSGLFYVYAPYHAVDIYVRGAVGEYWALAFIPLVFYGLILLFENNFWGTVIAVVGFVAVILSHNLTAMMIVPFLFLAIIILIWKAKKKYQMIKNLFIFMILSLGLTIFYWLPAYTEMGLTKVGGQIGGGADFRDHFVYIDQLWSSIWGYGGSAPGRPDGMSFMIGKLHIIVSLLSSFVLLYSVKRKQFFQTVVMVSAIIILITSIFFTNSISQIIWEIFNPMAYFQYPWRFLILIIFAAALLSGSLIWFFRNRVLIALVMAIILLVGLIIFNFKFFQPQEFISITANEIIDTDNILWHTSKISDEYLPTNFILPKSKDETALKKIILTGKATINSEQIESNQQIYSITAQQDSVVVVNTAYFPWWNVYLNGDKILPKIGDGRLVLNIKSGENIINILYSSTLIQTFSNYISLLSILILFTLTVKQIYSLNIKRNNTSK